MPKPLDPAVGTVLKQYGFGREAIWDCHGTWVVYHRVLEQIAAKAGIHFDMPMPLEANGTAKTVALCVRGHHDNRIEWSVGEASPANNKNSYPYAMAEKRAKDRVILKLIGLHGLVYSEEEADDFKDSAQRATGNGRGPDWGKASQAKKNGDWQAFETELSQCETVVAVDQLRRDYERNTYPNWNQAWRDQADEAFAKRHAELEDGVISDPTLPPNGEVRTVAASRQNQGRNDRAPGPRMLFEESAAVGETLIAVMRVAKTQSDLEKWKENNKAQIDQLVDEHFYSLRLEYGKLFKKLPESTLVAG